MTPNEYSFLRDMLKQRSGLVLSGDKQYLVESRLTPVARRHGFASLSELLAAARSPGKDGIRSDITEAMTTNESFFFRDKTPFDHFNEVMLPRMLAARIQQRRMRIWCAAASTGQEPYSLAICLKEAADKLAAWRVEIVGTDLSGEVLEKAKSGIYSQFEVQRGLPIQYLVKYFTQVGDLWQIAPAMRAMVRYQPLNLLQDFSSLGMFDIIFCRNVLIYFDQQTKIETLRRLGKQLAPDGFLVLGAAETVIGLTTEFESHEERRGLYVHAAKPDAAVPAAPHPAVATGLRQTA